MKQKESISRNKLGKAMLSVLMSLISILYVLPVLAVVLNSFKLNTFVKTETFAWFTQEMVMPVTGMGSGLTTGAAFTVTV